MFWILQQFFSEKPSEKLETSSWILWTSKLFQHFFRNFSQDSKRSPKCFKFFTYFFGENCCKIQNIFHQNFQHKTWNVQPVIASSFHSNLSLASHLKKMEMADVKNPDQFMNMFFGQHVISVEFQNCWQCSTCCHKFLLGRSVAIGSARVHMQSIIHYSLIYV